MSATFAIDPSRPDLHLGHTLARYRWNDRMLTGPALVRFLDADEARVRAVFRKLGAGPTDASGRPGAYPTVVVGGLFSTTVTVKLQAPPP